MIATVSKKQRISNGAFRHVEHELYLYRETKREVERLRMDIIQRGLGEMNDQTVVQTSSEWNSDTENRATALMIHKSIVHMSNVIEAIESTLAKLDAPQRKMIALRYWERPGISWESVANHPEVSADESTCRRWRNGIIEMIAMKLGWS